MHIHERTNPRSSMKLCCIAILAIDGNMPRCFWDQRTVTLSTVQEMSERSQSGRKRLKFLLCYFLPVGLYVTIISDFSSIKTEQYPLIELLVIIKWIIYVKDWSWKINSRCIFVIIIQPKSLISLVRKQNFPENAL